MDLTHGHNFECSGDGIWGDAIRWDLWDPEYGDEKLLFGTQAHRKCDGWTNALIDAFLRKTEAFRPMYYKRLAECLGHYYHPDVLLPKIERWHSLLKADAAPDMARWPSFGSGGGYEKSYSDLVRWTRKRYQHLSAKLKALGYDVVPPLNADF